MQKESVRKNVENLEERKKKIPNVNCHRNSNVIMNTSDRKSNKK